MKRIETLEKLREERKYYKEAGINATFGDAYFYSKDAGNELINFGGTIWERDIDEILECCKKYEITEFTISSTFSGLVKIIAEFTKRGCKLDGLVEINSYFVDIFTNEKERIPAFKMIAPRKEND